MTPADVKHLLLSKIEEVSSVYKDFSVNPSVDFTRNRKLSFKDVVTCIIGMNGNPLRTEIMEWLDYSTQTVSSSAFIQQRSKIKPEAFEYVFRSFYATVKDTDDLRLLAVDGSDLHIPTNPMDTESFFAGTNGQKSYNLLHLNALYDLERNIYIDAIVQKRLKVNESKALVDMVERSEIKQALVIADRGYESYNNMAHIMERGWKFLIRVKESRTGICFNLDTPKDDCFDYDATLSLCRKQTKETKELFKDKNSYRFIPTNCTFDYLPLKNSKGDPTKFFTLTFRVVRFKITENSYETVVTNLDRTTYPPERIKELYAMRWGIETSFRDLKYTVGLVKFHTKKVMCIKQEIFARLIMYNFVEMITSHVIINGKPKQYIYKANFSAAVYICRAFFSGKATPPLVEATISNNTIPIRTGRRSPRKVRTRRFAGFLYRVA